jgi:hypothetical protein
MPLVTLETATHLPYCHAYSLKRNVHVDAADIFGSAMVVLRLNNLTDIGVVC